MDLLIIIREAHHSGVIMSFGPELYSHEMITLRQRGHQLLMLPCGILSHAESMPMDAPPAEFPMADEGLPSLAEDTPDYPNEPDNNGATTEQTDVEPQTVPKQSASQVSAA